MHRIHHLPCLGLNLLYDSADLLRRIQGLIRQLADLLCHHGESPPGISGPGCLNGSVQGQQIGLGGNLVNHFRDIADGLRLIVQGQNILPDGAGDFLRSPGLFTQIPNDLHTVRDGPVGVLRYSADLIRIFIYGSDLIRQRIDLNHTVLSILRLQRHPPVNLINGPQDSVAGFHQLLGAASHLSGGLLHRPHHALHFLNQGFHAGNHMRQASGDLAELVLSLKSHLRRKISPGYLVQGPGDLCHASA